MPPRPQGPPQKLTQQQFTYFILGLPIGLIAVSVSVVGLFIVMGRGSSSEEEPLTPRTAGLTSLCLLQTRNRKAPWHRHILQTCGDVQCITIPLSKRLCSILGPSVCATVLQGCWSTGKHCRLRGNNSKGSSSSSRSSGSSGQSHARRNNCRVCGDQKQCSNPIMLFVRWSFCCSCAAAALMRPQQQQFCSSGGSIYKARVSYLSWA